MSSCQSGYKKKHSTITALLKITDDLKNALDKSKFNVLVLLDFSKAFDSIVHEILYQKLRSRFSFDTLSIKLITSYLCNRKQFVCTSNDCYSEMRTVNRGVPQGSILGPLLFSLYINDLPDVLSNSSCHMYADDCQIYCSGDINSLRETISNINLDIGKIVQWSKENYLNLNASKTQSIVICNRNSTIDNMRKINVIDHVQIENVKIDYVNEVKNLGIVFDSHLSWESQAKCVYQKVNFSLHSLIDQNRFLDFETKVKLVKSLVLPIITYGDLLFSMASKEALERLNKSYNACIRFIFNLKKYDHISTYR